MKEGTCRFNTSFCTLLKFWEAVGGLAEKQVTGCERAQQFSGAEYKHENFPLNGDLSEANTLRDLLHLAISLLLPRRTYSTAVSPACPSCLGEGSPFMCLLTSSSMEHCRASPTSIHCWDSFWMIILMSTRFNDHSIQPLTINLLSPILHLQPLTTPLSTKLLMDLDEINPLTSSSI